MTYLEKYEEKFDKFEKGLISEEEWNNFCSLVLVELMEKDEDVLMRLKEWEW